MEKNKKVAIGLGVGVGGAVLVLALRAKGIPPVEPPPEGEAFFIMEGGVSRERTWPASLDIYTITGTLKNIGTEVGTTEIMGWFMVSNFDLPFNVCSRIITLAPGESEYVSCEITREQMEEAQSMAGYSGVPYGFVNAYVSTYGHAREETQYGWLCTQDMIYVY